MAFIKNVRDMVQLDEMWRSYIYREDDSLKHWNRDWGWIMKNYECLKKDMDEKTAASFFLHTIMPEQLHDDRKFTHVPETTNHMYGWVANSKGFEMKTYGPDFFKAKPLPDYYQITKNT